VPNERRDSTPPPGAGLCAACRHARVVTSPRSRFLRCGLSDTDPRFARYPSLPVARCAGFEPGATPSPNGIP